MNNKAASPGLFETLREVGVAMLAIAHSRATLAGIELAEERERLLHRGLLAVLAVLAFGLSAAVFTLLVVVIFWDTWRVQVLVGFFLLYAALGLWCLVRMRAEAAQAPILLERTLAELEHDLETLKR